MQNNKLANVDMKSSALPKERHNLSRDVHTTFNFGEFQPTFVREMEAQTTMKTNCESAVLLAPMVGPTMGRLNLEHYGKFVRTLDILPCFKEYMTATRFTYGTNSFVPLYRPVAPLAILSLMCLYGATCSLYDQINMNLVGTEDWNLQNLADTESLLAKLRSYYNIGGPNTYLVGNRQVAELDGKTFKCIRSDILLAPLFYGTTSILTSAVFQIPLKGETSLSPGAILGNPNGDAVDINSADYVIQVPYADSGTQSDTPADKMAAFAFKLSDFGKRIRKVMIGVGYRPNFDTNQSRDITPLLAVFKAYYDMFGVLRWSNWQDTPACKLINTWLFYKCPLNLSIASNGCADALRSFMVSLARLWYSSQPDYVSAHTANIEEDTAIHSTPAFFDVGATLGDIGLTPQVVQTLGSVSATDVDKNYHAAIVRTLHSQLDAELLQKMYLNTNRDSVIGLRCAELLRAQGHGRWVDEHKSSFIGKFSIPLKLSPVVSQSDTFQSASDEGALLGEYGGRGIGYGENSVMSFKADEHGWFVVLAAVVPKAGFAQGDEGYLERSVRNDEYQPIWDGVGMEATRKSSVLGSCDWNHNAIKRAAVGLAVTPLDMNFGFIPQESRYKVIHNIANGDIDIGSRRNYFGHFTLDRMIYPDRRTFRQKQNVGTNVQYTLAVNGFTAYDLPIAGEIWRFPTRYAWLCNFMRIFALRGDSAEAFALQIHGYGDAETLEVVLKSPDSFVLHQIQDNQYYAGMRLIAKSYETKLEGAAGSSDMQSSKA